jgi:hypothetical protein
MSASLSDSSTTNRLWTVPALPAAPVARPSLLREMLEQLRPQSMVECILWMSIVVVGQRYWLVTAFQRPHDSLAVAAMYRHHDMQYYPLISALADGNIGEGNLWENRGQGLVSFPFASVSLHALCLRLFGIVGLMVADGLGTLCYFLVVLAFLRLFVRSSLLATCLAFLITGNILDLSMAEYLRHLPGVPDELRFRGYRIPRPFITEIHFVACMSLALWILGRPEARQSKWVWGSLGAFLALLLQGDFHGFVIVAMTLALLGTACLAFEYRRLGNLTVCVLVCLGVFLAVSPVFWLQRLMENPEMPRRLGMFTLPRGQIWHLPDHSGLQKCLEAAAFLAGFSFLMRRGWKQQSHGVRAIGLACFAIVAHQAIFVMGYATGKGIQLYHFGDRLTGIVSYCWVALLGYLVESFCVLIVTIPWRGLAERLNRWAPTGLKAAVLVIAGAGVLLAFHDEAQSGPNLQHMRLLIYPELTNYRDDFAALAVELAKPEYADCKVLATLDHQVFSWWVSFHRGYSFLPDPFSTTVPDAEIERRVVWFSHEVNLSSASFLELLRSRMFRNLWLGHDKYQCSKVYHFAPLDDYEPAALAAYENSTIFDCWVQAVPLSEQRRLLRLFELPLDDLGTRPRLDLIVTGLSPRLPEPSKSEYELVYRNTNFQVWRRGWR